MCATMGTAWGGLPHSAIPFGAEEPPKQINRSWPQKGNMQRHKTYVNDNANLNVNASARVSASAGKQKFI